MISNAVTLFRMSLVLPLFILLAMGGPGWIALALYLGSGLLDVVDGKLARGLGESSPLGAMLDLVADRLLTLAAVAGLLVHGDLGLAAACAAVILVARCNVVASFGEALATRPALVSSRFEYPKIVLSFAGLGLAMMPLDQVPGTQIELAPIAETLIVLAAALTLVTLTGYARQTVRALAGQGG
ncbi:CDP-alcohol phosphatidyltransferase family protein [Maricaulis sp.]|uniref:CDP-alcohol phosphatidyltransferase family protein n=1 Tax=Maricaulis sp. TaxID=1486257 RepID=UPI003A9036A1